MIKEQKNMMDCKCFQFIEIIQIHLKKLTLQAYFLFFIYDL